MRAGRVGWDDAGGLAGVALLGPWVGHERVVGAAGMCGADDCSDGWCAVRTGSPACGRAEFVVPTPGRCSSGFGTGAVSSDPAGGCIPAAGFEPPCPFADGCPPGACPLEDGCPPTG